jgi:O-acetyl-ADP-ribose deacetylase (regulator of RNase III)
MKLNNVNISIGSIEQTEAAAIVVPRSLHVNPAEGLEHVLRNAGFGPAIDFYNNSYNHLIEVYGQPPRDGSAIIVGNGNPTNGPPLIYASVIDPILNADREAPLPSWCSREAIERRAKEIISENFDKVRIAFYSVLSLAEQCSITSIATPAFGTEDGLTPEESAHAMLSALEQYVDDGGHLPNVTIVIDHDDDMHRTFQRVLDSGEYRWISASDHRIAAAPEPIHWSQEPPRIGKLPDKVRSYLADLFNAAAEVFIREVNKNKQVPAGCIPIPPSVESSSLVKAFRKAAAVALTGDLDSVNRTIDAVRYSVDRTASLNDRDALRAVRNADFDYARNRESQYGIGLYDGLGRYATEEGVIGYEIPRYSYPVLKL